MTKFSDEFPKEFEERVLNDAFLGEKLLVALNSESPTSIRIHSKKYKNHLPNTTSIPWSKNGLWLSERPSFTLDPHFHGGAYYPQEAGSQFLDLALRSIELPENPVVLDLCAAPGGKSTLIADFLDGKGLLLANEIIGSRSKILKENLVKAGYDNTFVSNNNPKDFENLKSIFDLIVVDAPCSGEGMFRKDKNARNEWSENNVTLCATRQKRILEDIWSSLKQDGYLIYSTCTFNRKENEDIVDWILNQCEAKIVSHINTFATFDREKKGFYALPSEISSEGFYYTIIQKKSFEKTKKEKSNTSKLSLVNTKEFPSNLIQKEGFSYIKWSDYLFAVPKECETFAFLFHQHLRIIKIGTECGEFSRKGLIYNEALAFSTNLRPEVPFIELNKQEALMYLKGETFNLNAPIGYVLMTFEGTYLGWIKNLGNRFNNLFPKEWRIRMDIK